MKFLALIINIILFFNIINDAASQSRMKNSKSQSEVIKNTNPAGINSVGKIEGTEVQRSQRATIQNDYSRQMYDEQTPYFNENNDEDWQNEDFFSKENTRSNSGFSKF